jgi:hypothetical protein
MKKGRILILFGAFVMSPFAFVYGQDYAFKVLANKGANEVRTGNAWQAVKTGASLKAGDELKVSENSYLGLVHASGKPIELKQAGSYKVDELAAKVKGGTNVLNKYTDFILSSNSAEAKKNRLSATGAVHRGIEDIILFLPENQHAGVYNHLAIINWEPNPKLENVGPPYVVTLINMFGDELMKVETSEKTIQVDVNDAKFIDKESGLLVDLLVEVHPKSNPKSSVQQRMIKRLTPAERENVKTLLTEFSAQVSEETAFNKYLLAGFYEQNKLFIDAITAYEQAIKMAPDVPTFKEDYEDFLFRNKLKKKPE